MVESQPDESVDLESGGGVEGGLVASVRRDLAAVGREATFHGQLALQLAGRLADRDESGISALSKELRTVMATALDGAAPADSGAPASAPEAGPASAGEVDDEVTRARRQREEARQAAGLA